MLKIGKITSPLYHFKLKDIIEKTANPIEVVPDKKYTQIGIRSHGKGIFIKEEVTGAELGNKRVFGIEPDCFIVNIVFAWERAVARTTSDLEGLIASHRFPMYRVDNLKVDLDYFTRLFLTKKGQMLLELASPGGAGRNKTLGQKEFLNLEIDLPTVEIQEYLSSFLKLIDKRIQLQQEKVELLKEQKKGFMQKIFSQELRFKGFVENWKQAPLKNVANFYNNLRVPITSINRIKGNTPYYGANGIQDYVEGFTHDGEFILIAEDGASDLINYPVNYVKGKLWVNNHAHVVNGKSRELDTLYLASRIKSMNITPWLVGGGRAKLNGEILKKIPISYPSFEEQKIIGEFFNMYDKKINLQQEKLNLLQKQKQTFMQQMFI